MKLAMYSLYLEAGQPRLDDLEEEIRILAESTTRYLFHDDDEHLPVREVQVDAVLGAPLPKRDAISAIIGGPTLPGSEDDVVAVAVALAQLAGRFAPASQMRSLVPFVKQVRAMWIAARIAPAQPNPSRPDRLVGQGPTTEAARYLQELLASNAAIDDLSKFLESHTLILSRWRGVGDARVIASAPLGNGATIDFSVGVFRATTNMWEWTLVMLASPADDIFLPNGDRTPGLRNAFNTSAEWRTLIMSHAESLQNKLPGLHPAVPIVVFIGRRSRVLAEHGKRLHMMQLATPGFMANTYDVLLDIVEANGGAGS